jgi:TolB-like protein/DNA-binding winged helix-turn-helix (wHTH) protein
MTQPLRFGAWNFDPDALVVSDGTTRVELEPRVGRLLEVFLAHPGEVLSHDALVHAVWDGRVVSDEAIRRAVSGLRHAIPAPGPTGYIRTVHKKGYVGCFPSPRNENDGATGSANDAEAFAAQLASPAPRRSPSRAMGAGVAALFVVLAALALVSWWRPPAVVPPSGAGLPHSLAVLPFANLSDTPGMDYFSDGMADELLGLMARNPAFRVTGRTSSFRFRDGAHDASAIGRALGVDHLIEGSVRLDDRRVRISAALVDAGTGFQRWSDTYDVGLDDVFAVQVDIAAKVARALQVVIVRADEPSPAIDAEAHLEYLKGRQRMASWVVADVRAARRHFERAGAVAPK